MIHLMLKICPQDGGCLSKTRKVNILQKKILN